MTETPCIIDGARLKSPIEAPLPRRCHSVQRALSKTQFASAQPTKLWLASGSRSDLRPLRALQLLFELIRQFQPTAAPSNSLSASCSPQPFHISGDWQLRRN